MNWDMCVKCMEFKRYKMSGIAWEFIDYPLNLPSHTHTHTEYSFIYGSSSHGNLFCVVTKALLGLMWCCVSFSLTYCAGQGVTLMTCICGNTSGSLKSTDQLEKSGALRGLGR